MTRGTDYSELIGKLADGIGSLTSSERWQSYLDFQSRFHSYSYGNALLIAAQRSGATHVAGFSAWLKLDRCVRKGETAIWILAPVVSRSADTNDGEDEQRVVRGFRRVAVFDIAQTDGGELPSVCTRLDEDDAYGVYAKLVVFAHSIGFAVEDHEFRAATSGDCSHRERRIRVGVHNSPAQRVKTLAHELAHAQLHKSFESRELAELEAESTAYVVCKALGIDSGDYSFGYVAAWAGGGDEAIARIKTSCERIQKTAAAMLQCFEMD
jgi:antirestriction protein ArdC